MVLRAIHIFTADGEFIFAWLVGCEEEIEPGIEFVPALCEFSDVSEELPV